MDKTIQHRIDLFSWKTFHWICLLIIPSGLVFYYWAGGKLSWPLQLFGSKTDAPLDFWVIQHVVNGVVFARIHRFFQENLAKKRWQRSDCFWTVLVLAYIWEAFEVGAENGVWGIPIASWFYGVEHWANRIIADPLLVGAGALIFILYPKSFKPAFAIAAFWLLINLIMPDSMLIQNYILTLF